MAANLLRNNKESPCLTFAVPFTLVCAYYFWLITSLNLPEINPLSFKAIISHNQAGNYSTSAFWLILLVAILVRRLSVFFSSSSVCASSSAAFL